jgi:coenzyme PQQ precursor peptide PqqA
MFDRLANVAVRSPDAGTCITSEAALGSTSARTSRQTTWETPMSWKTPKIVEVPVGMEINMYACAARK